jgi:hypothetical protein
MTRETVVADISGVVSAREGVRRAGGAPHNEGPRKETQAGCQVGWNLTIRKSRRDF